MTDFISMGINGIWNQLNGGFSSILLEVEESDSTMPFAYHRQICLTLLAAVI